MFRSLLFLMLLTRLQAQEFSLASPLLHCDQVFFRGFTQVRMDFAMEGAAIRYTLDGSVPDIHSPQYLQPLRVDHSAAIKARAFHPDYLPGEPANLQVWRVARQPPASVQLAAPPADDYNTNDCQDKLVDGRAGTGDFRDGAWLGFSANDLDGRFRWRKPVSLRTVMVHYMENTRSWIFPPAAVEVYAENKHGQSRLIAQNSEPERTAVGEDGLKVFSLPLPPGRYRNLRVVVRTWGPLPDTHPGKGNLAWLFIDEITFQ